MTSHNTRPSSLRAICMLPGMPHLLLSDQPQYQALVRSAQALGQDLIQRGVQRIVYFSTQWLAVLDQLVQGGSEVRGIHVDPSWHEMGEIPFDFQIDRPFAETVAREFTLGGQTTKLIDYCDFPIDTGTIVADRLLQGSSRAWTTMVACNVYSSFEDTRSLGQMLGKCIAGDPRPTAVCCVAGLSGHMFTTPIQLTEDTIRLEQDDTWNRRIIGLLEKGKHAEILGLLDGFAQEARSDMGFKAFALCLGLADGAGIPLPQARCHAYGPIYGTGAAVLSFLC